MDPITLTALSIVGAVFTGCAGAATTYYLSKRKNKSRISLELKFQLSILILAIQETGKTTFIRKVFNDPKADPTQRTKAVGRYRKLVSLPDNPDTGCEIYVTDYDGRDLRQLSDVINTGLAPVETTVVGIIVDTTSKNDTIEMDQDRIAEHINAWDRASLQLILGQVQHAKYFFVYVNKLDLIEVDKKEICANEFSRITEALVEATDDPSLNPDIFIGSLATGEHIPTIIDNAMRVRVRASHD